MRPFTRPDGLVLRTREYRQRGQERRLQRPERGTFSGIAQQPFDGSQALQRGRRRATRRLDGHHAKGADRAEQPREDGFGPAKRQRECVVDRGRCRLDGGVDDGAQPLAAPGCTPTRTAGSTRRGAAQMRM